MKHIYCISGFGADERMFSKFQFPGYEIHFIKWITPEKNENIQSYAKRLIEQIHHNNPILIGLSFGGMICVEIGRQINTYLIIIISSIKSHTELPLWMRLSGMLKLNRLLPMRSYKLIQPLQDYNMGIRSTEEKALVHNYRKNIDRVYSNWAINAILNWKNTVAPENLYHIHGDGDRIFSIKRIKPDYTINKGGHLMILNKSEEVNECISSILRKHSDC
ncbi:MAG: alpha/beta hydrolase [Chitinophagaceae bacterium]|nr:alpha/beta hydrolase [Chitinophagaceae bacterium]